MRAVIAMALLVGGCAARAEVAPSAEQARETTSSGASAPSMRSSAPPAASDAEARSHLSMGAERQLAFDDHEALTLLAADVEALATAQDCGSACAGGERLCDLSERICAIAERLPNDGEIGARCADGRERCRHARARLAEACGCGGE